MTTPHERIAQLLALAADPSTTEEEGRTAAHTAARLVKKYGMPPGAPAPAPPETVQETMPDTSSWDRKKKDMLHAALDEAIGFLKTIDVLPRAPRVDRPLQMAPAPRAGRCPSCDHSFVRGEMVSREPKPRCGLCAARRATSAF